MTTKYTMQDGAPGIFNAVNGILKPQKGLNCWFHVKQALHKKKRQYTNLTQETFRSFEADVNILHAAQTQTEFHEGASLFIKKWTPIHADMTK